MAYGTAAGVAALSPRYANSAGAFDTSTTPPLAHVTDWVAQISAMLNVAMSGYGVTTPVTDADITPMMDVFVNAWTAAVVRGVNGQGKFAEKPMTADEMLLLIGEAAEAWVKRNIGGIGSQLGVVTAALATPTVSIGSFLRKDGYSDNGSEYAAA